MALTLRQNTATTIWIGPFIAATDGFTRQTTLALTGSGLFIQKLGGSFAIGTSTATLGGGSNGWYSHSLATSEADTTGRMRVDYNATGSAISLPVWHEYMVLHTHTYDSLITAADKLQTNVKQWMDNNISTTTGGVDVNVIRLNGNAVTATGSLFTADVVQWTHQSLTTSTGSLPNVNAAKVNNATPETATDIAEEVWNLDCTLYQTQGTFGQAIGDPGSDPSTIWSLVNTNLDMEVSAVSAQVMSQTVEGTTTLVQAARGWNAVLLGNSEGVDTGAPIYKSISGAQNRWTGVATDGNRTRTNLDLTAT